MTSKRFEWTCTNGSKDLDDSDDYVCHWNSLMLRAELMSIASNMQQTWYWAVYDANGKTIDGDVNQMTGQKARQCAEMVAKNFRLDTDTVKSK